MPRPRPRPGPRTLAPPPAQSTTADAPLAVSGPLGPNAAALVALSAPGPQGPDATAHTSLAASGPRGEGGGRESGRGRGGRQQQSTVFLMHLKPNGECARRCLQTETLQLSFKKAQLCRGARHVHTLTRLIAMAPIGGPKNSCRMSYFGPLGPHPTEKSRRAPAAPELRVTF